MPDWNAITRGARPSDPDAEAALFPKVPTERGTGQNPAIASSDECFAGVCDELSDADSGQMFPNSGEHCSQNTLAFLGTGRPNEIKDIGGLFPSSQCSHEKIEAGGKEDDKNRVPGLPDQAAGAAGARASTSRSRIRRTAAPLDPAACVWLIRWAEHCEEQSEPCDLAKLYARLRTLPTTEQRDRLRKRLTEAGLNPWRQLALPLPPDGKDCQLCRHNGSHVGRLDDGDRRRFWWACAKGYQMLVYYRASERIPLAPPECDSWEHWRSHDAGSDTGRR